MDHQQSAVEDENLKASSDLSTSEASLEQEFNGRTMRRTFHSSAIWRRNAESERPILIGHPVDHNPYHQVNLVRTKSEHFLKVNHRRKLQDIMKDIKIINAITNTPIPPPLPLTGLDHLKVNLAARKYI
uniref:Uncharacterized protein n=1 Tax=Caenorhabditis japonica TaxID=281687 RepID=A0A8R1ER66_CAEJA